MGVPGLGEADGGAPAAMSKGWDMLKLRLGEDVLVQSSSPDRREPAEVLDALLGWITLGKLLQSLLAGK